MDGAEQRKHVASATSADALREHDGNDQTCAGMALLGWTGDTSHESAPVEQEVDVVEVESFRVE
jgi:hypothetical protein